MSFDTSLLPFLHSITACHLNAIGYTAYLTFNG